MCFSPGSSTLAITAWNPCEWEPPTSHCMMTSGEGKMMGGKGMKEHTVFFW